LQRSLETGWGGGREAALTVSALAQHLALLVREDVILQDVWVRGEVTTCTRAASGHVYLTLKDAGAVLPAVLFRSAAWRLRFKPEVGVQVLAHGEVQIYAQRGQYQLVVDSLHPAGQGRSHQQLDALRARLLAEGLLSPERKRPLPAFPETVAVVTSPAGAALQDIAAVLRRSAHPPTVVVVAAQVQGMEAEASIVRALRLAEDHTAAQVIVVARGGGAAEDLWCFNSESVARRIAGCRVPVISAVGHESDMTLADLAADRRVPTPTAAAELVLALLDGVVRRGEAALARARHIMQARAAHARLRLEAAGRRAPLSRPGSLVENRRQDLDHLARRLSAAGSGLLEGRRGELAVLAGQLQGLSPLATLARGYAAVTRLPDGVAVTSRAEVLPGDAVRVRLRDGAFDARVEGLDEAG
jgi:exodeoxyribonuclease VII large subunit